MKKRRKKTQKNEIEISVPIVTFTHLRSYYAQWIE